MNHLELTNVVLDELNFENISSLSDRILESYPYNMLLDFINEATTVISLQSYMENSITETELAYTENKYIYKLGDYDIIENRVLNVFYYDENFNPVYLEMKKPMLVESYLAVNSEKAESYCYSIDEGNITLYPIPDKDYRFTICHYKLITKLQEETSDVDVLRDKDISVISQYCSFLIQALVDSSYTQEFQKEYLRKLSRLKTIENRFLNEAIFLPNNIGF